MSKNASPVEPLSLAEAESGRGPFLHPLAGAAPGLVRELVRNHGQLSARSRLQRWATRFVAGQREVYSRLEDWIHREKKDDGLENPPVFIVGHWGSGTTLLHDLLSSSGHFAYLRFSEALMPRNMLFGHSYFSFFVRPFIPTERGFDQVRVSLNSPQEEELALANLGALSFFHTFYFPQDAKGGAERALFPEREGEEERLRFERSYRMILTKMDSKGGGKPLLMKNPAATTRIPLLRRLFPGAKFIYLVRDPNEVFASSLNRFPNLFREFAWQEFSDVDVRELTFELYEQVQRSYLKTREVLPEGVIHEVRFEELTQNPSGTIDTILNFLDVNLSEAEGRELQIRMEQLAQYQRRPRLISQGDKAAIAKRWKFAFETWDFPFD